MIIITGGRLGSSLLVPRARVCWKIQFFLFQPFYQTLAYQHLYCRQELDCQGIVVITYIYCDNVHNIMTSSLVTTQNFVVVNLKVRAQLYEEWITISSG